MRGGEGRACIPWFSYGRLLVARSVVIHNYSFCGPCRIARSFDFEMALVIWALFLGQNTVSLGATTNQRNHCRNANPH